MPIVDCDLLISTSHCAIKALKASGRHISYIHAPMRYVWDQYEQYYQRAGIITRLGMAMLRSRLRRWDISTCHRVHGFVANSHNVAKRIKRHYQRDALVVHPPVDLARFNFRRGPVRSYYLVVSSLVPYKRVDLAIAACNELKLPLKVVGIGPEAASLRKMAGPSIEFLGWRDEQELAYLYAGARALLFPGEEDFGITPLEAMASACPVLAFGRGGALETVLGHDSPQPTGRFFYEQNASSLAQALRQLERDLPHFNPAHLSQRADQFSIDHFKRNLIEALLALL